MWQSKPRTDFSEFYRNLTVSKRDESELIILLTRLLILILIGMFFIGCGESTSTNRMGDEPVVGGKATSGTGGNQTKESGASQSKNLKNLDRDELLRILNLERKATDFEINQTKFYSYYQSSLSKRKYRILMSPSQRIKIGEDDETMPVRMSLILDEEKVAILLVHYLGKSAGQSELRPIESKIIMSGIWNYFETEKRGKRVQNIELMADPIETKNDGFSAKGKLKLDHRGQPKLVLEFIRNLAVRGDENIDFATSSRIFEFEYSPDRTDSELILFLRDQARNRGGIK